MIHPALHTGDLNVALMMFSLVATVSMSRDPIFGSVQGLTLGRDLMWISRSGLLDGTEGAAFLVDRGNGELACMVWPTTHRRHTETFRGPMPLGTVAIIHTHPRSMPMPSPQDGIESLRLGIPIYVLTPTQVTKAEPTGEWPVIVHKGKWLARSNGGSRCKVLEEGASQ